MFEPLEKALRIESERLLLRPIEKKDTDLVLSLRNADYVKSNFFYRMTISKEEHLRFFEEKCKKGLVFYFLVYEKESQMPIGCVYMQHYDKKKDSIEAGLFFSENAPKKKGYATEAYILMIEYAFNVLGVSFLEARVISTNNASLSLHKRCGFLEVQRTVETVFPTGEEVEAVTLRMTFDRYKQIAEIQNRNKNIVLGEKKCR